MTIKKITLSVVALSTISSALMAGTLQYGMNNSQSLTISNELEQTQDENGTINFNGTKNSPLIYKATIDQDNAVSDPNIKISVIGGKFNIPDYSKLRLVEVNATDNAVDVISDSASDNGDGGILFDGDSAKKIINGHTYQIVDDSNNTIAINVEKGTGYAGKYMQFQTYSASGTTQKRDEANATKATVLPEWSIVCDGKLDGMINYENGSKTFVTTGHGADDQNTTDGLMFTIKRANVLYGLDDNITINTTADSNLTAMNLAITGDNLVYRPSGDNNASIDANVSTLSKGGSEHFILNYDNNTSAKLLETKFSDVNATFKNYSTVQPFTYQKGAALGEWKNFTYVAQIPGATANGIITTKLFITNRSCATVKPTFKLIYGGKTIDIKSTELPTVSQQTIPVDTQVVYKVNDLAKIAQDKGFVVGNGAFSVEVTLPGISESFYIYAQSKNTATNAEMKSLPVYNTSTRTY